MILFRAAPSVFAVLLVLLNVEVSAWSAEPPALPLLRAIELAQEQLDNRGLEKTVFIESVVLEKDAAIGHSRHWTIRWSQTLPASAGRIEIGAEVDMQGHVVRLVKHSGGVFLK
jgi:hypothetical protein